MKEMKEMKTFSVVVGLCFIAAIGTLSAMIIISSGVFCEPCAANQVKQELRLPSAGLAYVIAVHNQRTVHPLKRLISVLWREQDFFVIHVDKRADSRTLSLINATKEAFVNKTNIHFVSWRANLYPYNEMVESSVDMIQYAVEHSKFPWTHVIQLTGDSFPLQPPSVIQAVFALQPNKTWIDLNIYEHKNERITSCHKNEPLLVQPNRLRHGQSHWAFHYEMAKYISYSQFARDLLVWVDCGKYQDEHYFQTLFYNSPWSEENPDDRVMYAIWNEPKDTQPSKTTYFRRPRSEVINDQYANIAYKFGFLFCRKVVDDETQRAIEHIWETTPSPYQPFIDHPYNSDLTTSTSLPN